MMYRRILFTMTYDEIADDMGLGAAGSKVGRRLKNKYPILFVDGNKRYIVKKKYSTETVMRISKMREGGMSYTDIGRELGLANATVWLILNKRFRNATVLKDVAAAGGGGGE